jgi:uncharacterized phiE125 gp8 family phage protein
MHYTHPIDTVKIAVVTAATTEPVTVDDLMQHSRIDGDSEYDLLTRLIKTARQYFENNARLTLITSTFDAFYDGFNHAYSHNFHCTVFYPSNSALVLPKRPVQSVTSLSYVDANGQTQTLTQGTDFVVDTHDTFATLSPATGKTWPQTLAYSKNTVTVRFVAGIGNAAAVPDEYKTAILTHAGHLYDQREAAVVGQTVNVMPYSYQAIMDQAKTVEV